MNSVTVNPLFVELFIVDVSYGALQHELVENHGEYGEKYTLRLNVRSFPYDFDSNVSMQLDKIFFKKPFNLVFPSDGFQCHRWHESHESRVFIISISLIFRVPKPVLL